MYCSTHTYWLRPAVLFAVPQRLFVLGLNDTPLATRCLDWNIFLLLTLYRKQQRAWFTFAQKTLNEDYINTSPHDSSTLDGNTLYSLKEQIRDTLTTTCLQWFLVSHGKILFIQHH